MLEAARLAIDEARSEHTELKGTLRITTTVEYALAKVVPALELFRALHPDLNVQLSTSSTHADLISERFDVALRLGRVLDSSHRAVQLSTFEILPVASPAFVARVAPINSVQALEQTPWLEHGRVGELSITEVCSAVNRPYQPNPALARIKADNSSVLQAFALTGQGVAILPDWLIEDDLQAGRLVRLLPEWQLTRQGVYGAIPRYTAFATEGAGVYRFYEKSCLSRPCGSGLARDGIDAV
jgi:Transcriptional regulator